MRIAVGIDIAKEVHWVTAIDEVGEVALDRGVENTPADIAALIDELAACAGTLTIGLDVVGGIASLAEAMLAEAGFALVHGPGPAVNWARQGTVGGEAKSDPKDARVIADRVRTRRHLRPIEAAGELDIELRLLVGRRRDLVDEQTRRIARLHDLLAGIFSGLERVLDLTAKGGLWLIAKYTTPAELRAAGLGRLIEHRKRAGGLPNVERLADAAMAAAQEQRIALPGERMTAVLIRELADEALATRDRLARLDRDQKARLQHHPDGALICSPPGMGAVRTAELIAEAGTLTRFGSPDALASAAGLAPVLRQSGKVRFLKRPSGGDKTLKRIFHQPAFCSLHTPDSRAFYDRKRKKAKRHHQALNALARRRIDLLWAMLNNRQAFIPKTKLAA